MWGRSLLTEAWRIAELADGLEDAALKENSRGGNLRLPAAYFAHSEPMFSTIVGIGWKPKRRWRTSDSLALDLDERSLYGFIGLQLGSTFDDWVK